MTMKQNVIIKGTKDGLMFLLNDDCLFDDVIEEIKEKLEHSHQAILTGPIMRVTVKTGNRKLTPFQKELIKDVVKIQGNLYIHSFESEEDELKKQPEDQVQLISGTIRSGQVYRFEGNVLFVGDVNPGGNIIATGDIYILGSLRGLAHAGFGGNKDAVIAASVMKPTQLRIADVVSRSPDQWEKHAIQEYAYVKDDQVVIDPIQYFTKFKKIMNSVI
ncbi:septum site-determining protein MinC [Tepidibacillus infernus]|uniref:Probable septum site-determining protein MinC n=1 Tax=Tepidibacillus decaturensis TaxID=1413211 RepID=A0A135L222_9BACI|nr:septum site-determining protein MinC [Tepidibacillus decaturensis]KXG43061.1 septum site-determining protein MinC [Tepidibacillus decaturensis]